MSTVDENAETPTSSPMAELYRWSTWIHLGPGAEDCDEVDEATGTNECHDARHRHLWCRLPNQYQHREIREAALAAKARRQRLYRDADSDASVILDGELEALSASGDLAKEDVVNELVAKDWWRDFAEAQADVREVEDEDGAKLYEHIERDITRWSALSKLPAEERSADELAELEAHCTAYNTAVDAAREAAAQPRRDALMSKDVSELVDILRKQRIEADSNGYFTNEYATLEWLACTLRHPDGAPVFASREVLAGTDDSVLNALRKTFIDLENTQRLDAGGAPGNS